MTDHLSIGEVLSLLQDEFPDVTISKIRFLESQGLIDPERTPSGYRKFYESDIDRLRWILVQQREHFLPLKVIKDRLTDPDAGQGALELSADGAADAPPPPTPPHSHTASDTATATATATAPADEMPAEAAGAADPAPAADPEPAESASHTDELAGELAANEPIWMADLAKATAASKATAAANEAQLPLHMDAGPTEVSLTAQELTVAAGITRESLRELEQYGLVTGRPLGDAVYYDGDALLVSTKAAGFFARGVEARHLRMFKVAAEREAGFLEQLAMPLLKQRNPQARRDAVDLVEELSALGGDLRSALLRLNLRRHIDQA